MAKFLYKMQNVLNIKMRLETQAKTSYAEAAAKLDEEEQKLNELLARRAGYEKQFKDLMSSRLDVPSIKRCSDAVEITKELAKKQVVNVKVAERNLEAARARLSIAMQERKTHEKLKENAFEEFKLELNDQEKKEIDELVSFSYNDNKKTGED